MTIALTLSLLFTIAAVATALSLADSWLRCTAQYRLLTREKALLDAGFAPQVQASEVRLRRQSRRNLPAATRPYARRLPLRERGQDLGALQAAG